MCFVFIWEQTATCATYSINWLVFITEMKSVYSAVQTGYLNKAVCASSVKGQWNFLRQTAASRCEGFLTFRELIPPPSTGCCWWFARTKTGDSAMTHSSVLVLPNRPHTIKMGMELAVEMSVSRHIVTLLSARENSIKFCRRDSFKSYNLILLLNWTKLEVRHLVTN